MDSYITITSCVVVFLVTIYNVICLESTLYGRNQSLPFIPQYNGWSNSSFRTHNFSVNHFYNQSNNGWSSLPGWHAPQNSTVWGHNSQHNSWVRRPTHNNTVFPALGTPGNRSSASVDVSDNALRTFSEELFTRDYNNVAHYVTTNYQGQTTSNSNDDKAPQPLLQVDPRINNHPTISKLIKLYNNYIPNVNQNEVVTNEERKEVDDLLDAMLSTEVMDYTRRFLVEQGQINNNQNDFKELLKDIWFTLYSRSKKRTGSSGFEHIFLAELKNNEVSGCHNWMYFHNEESNNNLNYLGYLKYVKLKNKGAIVKHHFTFLGKNKPSGSMFIGTSPEFEVALYTTCFLLRPNAYCPLQVAGKKFSMKAYTIQYNGKQYIGSAYPII